MILLEHTLLLPSSFVVAVVVVVVVIFVVVVLLLLLLQCLIGAVVKLSEGKHGSRYPSFHYSNGQNFMAFLVPYGFVQAKELLCRKIFLKTNL